MWNILQCGLKHHSNKWINVVYRISVVAGHSGDIMMFWDFGFFQTTVDTVKVDSNIGQNTSLQISVNMPFDIRSIESPTHRMKKKVCRLPRACPVSLKHENCSLLFFAWFSQFSYLLHMFRCLVICVIRFCLFIVNWVTLGEQSPAMKTCCDNVLTTSAKFFLCFGISSNQNQITSNCPSVGLVWQV